ncbi:MAG: transglycosylase SLT domain-containing protein [Longimicrobiales bacterium]|nr:transglycosylase SLT domain-containing protein [Longimicrobiales bacterium]
MKRRTRTSDASGPGSLRGLRGLAAALATLPALACVGASAPPEISPPPLPASLVVLEPLALDTTVVPPPFVVLDPIVHSPTARDAELTAAVARWRRWFSETDPEAFRLYLRRMTRYAAMVDSVLIARELPSSLRYLPIVESGYLPTAVSSASAVGMWQFMSPVARSFGMQVTPLIDERRDPVAATDAATRFLAELHDRFDSWFLALAAYNGGPSRVERLLREHAPLAPGGDSLYMVIRPHLPRETQEFVPKFLAVAEVARAAGRLGLAPAPDEYAAPLAFDEIEVPDATSLDIVAAAAGVAEEAVLDLNPQVMRGVTPRGRKTRLRLPVGAAATFSEVFPTIPADERVTMAEHVVRSGDTLSEIAESYGIRTAELRAANPGLDPRRLQLGTRLVVPVAPGAVERVRGR